MTKDEIKAAVAAKIAGQGSMVDIGGALPAILDAIVDAIPEDIPTIHFLLENSIRTFTSFAEMASELHLTEEQLTMIMAGECKIFPAPYGGGATLFPTVIGDVSALYGGKDIGENMGCSIVFTAGGGEFSVKYSDV